MEGRVASLEKKLQCSLASKPVADQKTVPKVPRKSPPAKQTEKLADLSFEMVEESQPIKQPVASPMETPVPPTSVTIPEPVVNRTAQDDPHNDDSIEWLDIIASYFKGGNIVVRVGVIVLFFGVAFLLKYSIEQNMIPIEYRLISICLGAIAMLFIGWRLRFDRTTYALILQGGGVGILYLTIFASLKLYNVIPFSVALALLVALPVFSAALAIMQEARSLAVIGIIGGFLAPVLTSSLDFNHLYLFTYYAMLNGGILLTAWYRSWRELNILGFLFTFIISSAWGVSSFEPEMFSTTEPFLILFFLFYVAIGLLFASRQPLKHKGYIDCSMVFGTPIICFALQSKLIEPYEYGLAWSALAMGLIYASLAWLVFKRGTEAMRTMVESFLAMGVIFGTIAIPLALDGRWTSISWALEGSALIWIALRQDRPIARIFGLVMQVLAGLAFLSAINEPSSQLAVINGFCIGALFVAFAGFFSSYCLFLNKNEIETAGQESVLLLVWAILWWFGAGFHEIDKFVNYFHKPGVTLIFCSLSCVASYIIANKLFWDDLRHLYKGLLAAMIGCAVYVFISFGTHPYDHLGYINWHLAFISLYWLLYREDELASPDLLQTLHIGSLLLMIGLLSWEAHWWTDHLVRGAGIWNLATLAIVPSFFILLLSKYHEAIRWPVRAHLSTYLYNSLAPLALFLWVGTVLVNLSSKGDPWPLPYLPLLNPLDLTQIFVLIVLVYWSLVVDIKLGREPFSLTRKQRVIVVGGTVFLWLNAVLIRTLHYWGGVEFNSRAMISSDLVQTSLSIFWTLSAFAIMFWANRRRVRPVWMAGAGLIGGVVVKLFTFDLAHTGTIERIVSFLGVGVLCLIIGYLAPLPSQAEKGGNNE